MPEASVVKVWTHPLVRFRHFYGCAGNGSAAGIGDMTVDFGYRDFLRGGAWCREKHHNGSEQKHGHRFHAIRVVRREMHRCYPLDQLGTYPTGHLPGWQLPPRDIDFTVNAASRSNFSIRPLAENVRMNIGFLNVTKNPERYV